VISVLALAASAARADNVTGPGAACEAAGHAAEQATGLPTNLLLAIGMVESAHPDPASGTYTPWPWTVNADGQGLYFDSKQAAIGFVNFAQAAGARDIDVGCFQISLEAHPDAFASLDAAFDPASNAAYAAQFLTQLKGETGSWNAAIADYHSAEPDLGLPYQREVLARWQDMGNLPADLGGDVSQASFDEPDTVVIFQSAAAKKVHWYNMDTLASADAAEPVGAPVVHVHNNQMPPSAIHVFNNLMP